MSEPNDKLNEIFRRGGWLPASRTVLRRWIGDKVKKGRDTREPLLPPIQELKDMIENDGDMYMGFNRMFENATLVCKPFAHPSATHAECSFAISRSPTTKICSW